MSFKPNKRVIGIGSEDQDNEDELYHAKKQQMWWHISCRTYPNRRHWSGSRLSRFVNFIKAESTAFTVAFSYFSPAQPVLDSFIADSS